MKTFLVPNRNVTRGFEAGNYANAYETTDLQTALAKLSPNRSAEYVAAFTLGFFSSYSLGEMGSDVEAYREAYFSETGRACRAAGYVDIRAAEEWLALDA
jgi:hypothetical protein